MLISISDVAKNMKKMVDPQYRKKDLSRKDEAILKTIYSIANMGNKAFCTPKLSKIQELLKKRYKMQVAERTLRLHLRILEAKRYLIVRRMAGRTKRGTYIGRPNIYFITKKMRKFLRGMAKQITIWFSKDKSLLNGLFKEMEQKTVDLFMVEVNRRWENAKKTQAA